MCKQCIHGSCWSTHDTMLARVQAGDKARGSNGLLQWWGWRVRAGCAVARGGLGRVWGVWATRSSALELLWSGGPHRRAAEVALLAPLGGARRSREWSVRHRANSCHTMQMNGAVSLFRFCARVCDVCVSAFTICVDTQYYCDVFSFTITGPDSAHSATLGVLSSTRRTHGAASRSSARPA
jgi:hypothetical protein